MRTALFLVLGLLLPVVGAVAQQTDAPKTDALPSVTLPPELDRVLRDYETAWENRDAAALAALFASDGFILRPGHPPVRGREAIETAYQNAGGPLHLRALAYEQADAIAYIIGAYRSTPDRPDSGKFIVTLQRNSDGRWLITADMDNGNR
jgi:ketosteroid isomerase-like protein